MLRRSVFEQGQKTAMDRAVALAAPVLPWFDGTGNLLDYGCGVGHLGYCISENSGRPITSLDVRAYPFSHPSLKVEIFDGKTIPYPDNYFDMALVAYTLHHTSRPADVLEEIVRVTKGKIVVSEDFLKNRRHVPLEAIKDIVSNYFYAHITLQYKTVRQWEDIFNELGLSIKDRIFHNSGTWIRFKHVSWLLQKTT